MSTLTVAPRPLTTRPAAARKPSGPNAVRPGLSVRHVAGVRPAACLVSVMSPRGSSRAEGSSWWWHSWRHWWAALSWPASSRSCQWATLRSEVPPSPHDDEGAAPTGGAFVACEQCW